MINVKQLHKKLLFLSCFFFQVLHTSLSFFTFMIQTNYDISSKYWKIFENTVKLQDLYKLTKNFYQRLINFWNQRFICFIFVHYISMNDIVMLKDWNCPYSLWIQTEYQNVTYIYISKCLNNLNIPDKLKPLSQQPSCKRKCYGDCQTEIRQ